MAGKIYSFRHSLLTKVILTVSLTLFACISVWSYFNTHFQKRTIMENMVDGAVSLSDTIRLATHYAMLHNSRDDIRHITRNVGRQRDVERIRVYDKSGTIQFSSHSTEEGQTTNIKAEACDVCHKTEPPNIRVPLDERTRIFTATSGSRMLGVLTPIYNEPTCSGPPCHFHPPDKEVLGALDVVISLQDMDENLRSFEMHSFAIAAFAFLFTTYLVLIFVVRFVREPIRKLIDGTRLIARGERIPMEDVDEADEMGQLVTAINRMGREIREQQDELNRQRDEYQNLFENVPCQITVQDRNFRLIQYNREFEERFAPAPGDFCYHAYKNRDSKCENCPVEGTFRDGLPRYSEECGLNKDGSPAHWIVHTQPIRNDRGEVVAAMEMCLDITPRKLLEEKLEESERKYHAIFNQIPNPVFVLDDATLDILDCNQSVEPVYGYTCNEIKGTSFLDLFTGGDLEEIKKTLRRGGTINRTGHIAKSGQHILVDVMVAASEYSDRKVLLAITRDMTKRLATEQQLIQASKMATLGEMSTGVAHELNQPLSVLRTISGFFMRKLRNKEPIDEQTFIQMAQGVDENVERAAKIIEHMREFGYKSDLKLEKVHINQVIEKAFSIFDQQFKVRNIDVVWDLGENLPPILAEPNRLEQVVINLLINARDAVEERREKEPDHPGPDQVLLSTIYEKGKVTITVEDTGSGFPSAISGKLFEPFFTTKEVGKGTGLGLSISYGIVKDYRGDIRAERGDSGGARFVIAFSAADKDSDVPDWS
ncbi:PAS domain S-box protein [Desulfovibrio ferrophilus]|uniref:histidine kinase n=1 Tax=Desulfovibrio ferrophilus TaxID=241368 RepID=A0A2Z6B3I3_9BACT|nr:PAS domain S-box protein [Desulfovibrio ferrophilus]BBD10094.1 multi-sensor signal transduction histidine kinase [Desulfovibrio ferrophilus]